jgi:hypothetical protein
MILARASEQETWDILMQTWPTFSNGHIYRVLAKPGSKDLGVDGREAVNGSGSVDHTSGVIQLPLRESWDTLAIKTLSLWRYLSRSFNSDGWNTRCAWFVKLDTDSWINAPLLEARLGCLSPDRAIYTGFVPLRHVFAWGGFYLLSREVVRSVDGWMDLFTSTYKHPFGRKDPFDSAEDRAVGGLCTSNRVPPRRIALHDDFAFGGNRHANAFMSWPNHTGDMRRVCTLVVHPLKNSSLLQATHTLWIVLTKKWASYVDQAVRHDLCFPSDYSPKGQDDLIVDMIACSKSRRPLAQRESGPAARKVEVED